MPLLPRLFFPPFLRMACLLGFVAAAPALSAREVLAIYLPGGGESIPKAHLVGAGASVEVELPQRNLSRPVELPGGDLVLAALAAPPSEGEKLPAEAPRVKIPSTWNRCILVFLGDPSNKVLPVRIIPVNANSMEFPKGHTLVWNLSDSTIAGQFGKERILLKPGESKGFQPPMQEFGSYPVGIDCLQKGADKPRAITRSMWQHDPEARQILFVTPQQGNILPRVWGVHDRVPPEKKEEKEP